MTVLDGTLVVLVFFLLLFCTVLNICIYKLCLRLYSSVMYCNMTMYGDAHNTI